ncbi:MAG: hypothetical protein E7363_05860, partial [Clostridiales bacterium]|nr:hypothetical protein [Clostridiales bacterium]
MKHNNQTAKDNLLTPSHGGGAFTLAIFAGLFATLILSVIVSGIANAKHIPFDQATSMNGVIWLSYLLPQIALLGVGIGTMV